MLLEDFGQGNSPSTSLIFLLLFSIHSPGDDPQNFYDSLTYSVES